MTDPAGSTVAITGASGLIGRALVQSLTADRWKVLRLVRRPPQSADEIRWNPGSDLDPAALAGVDAVVNLAGAGVGDHRWTKRYKKQIRDSRVLGTGTIATAVARMATPVQVLINASAIGYYGDTGDREVDETAPPGTGFLAGVVQDWEAATAPARDAGIRTTMTRTGLVVSADGGAWARLLPLFRAGLGGRLGSGRQYWSFISLRDEVRALRYLMDCGLSGPVNLTAPHAVTNAEVAAAMGRALHRPALLPAPAFALKAALGEFSVDVLSSARVRPKVLAADGFTWLDPTIDEAIATLVGR